MVISESSYEAAFICCIIYPYHLGPGLTNFLVMQTGMLHGIWEMKKTFGVNLCICKVRGWMCLTFHAVLWVRSSSLLPRFLFFLMNFELPKNTFSVTQFKGFTERFISVLRSWCNFLVSPPSVARDLYKKGKLMLLHKAKQLNGANHLELKISPCLHLSILNFWKMRSNSDNSYYHS